ncbi:MAG: PilZ domain-containing protein [Aestuariivirgaceae bacterium]
MTVRVRRERPDQRRHHRVTAPLFLRVGADGQTIRATDWSLGGLRVDDYPQNLPDAGSEIDIAMTLPFQGFDISFTAKARVVRVVPDIRSFAVEFTEIGEREQELMHHFIEDLVRGAMSEVADSIQRIDVPITPVSTDPDPDTEVVVEEKRLPLRQITWVGGYSLLGFMVFGYMALVLYSNIFRMEIQTAVVASPTVEVRAQGDGQISFVRAAVGEPVGAGDTVIYFADYDLEKQIDMANLEISRREAELNRLLLKRAAELEKMNDYASVGLKNIEQVSVDVEALEAEQNAARARFERTRKLMQEGWATKIQLEEASQWLVSARAKLKSRRIELQEQMRLADSGVGKRFYNGRELLGKVGEVDAEIKLARYQIALAHQKHEALLKHRERIAVRAPFDGRLSRMPKPKSAAVKQGDIIAVFENDNERKVLAYLTQDEVIKIGLNDEARIYFPSLKISIRARVTGVDRTKGFQEEVARRYSWRSPDDRSAEVALALNGVVDEATRDAITPGLPAVVLFEARSTSPILAAIWRKISSLLL